MPQKLTLDQCITLMGATGVSMAPFGLFHEDVERRLGRPVRTHEFASKEMSDELKRVYHADLLAIIPDFETAKE